MTLSPKLRQYQKRIEQQALRLEKHPDALSGWLDQFSGREIPLILPLLESMHYISLVRERILLTQAALKLGQMGLDTPVYCSIGPGYKSSSNKLRQFMKVNGVSKEDVCVYEEIVRLDWAHHRDVVFIDDVIGTGDQVRRFLDPLEAILKGRRVVLVYLCGPVQSAQRVEADLGVEILLLDELPADFSAFSATVFPRQNDADASRKLCASYGASLEPSMPLGYRDSELLVAFHDFCPNNTLPIFWSVNHGWISPFPTPQPTAASTQRSNPATGLAAGESKSTASSDQHQDHAPGAGSQPRTDWADSPRVETFFGRRRELRTVTKWISQDRCRLVTIWGMGGVGKSSLTLRACRELVPPSTAVPQQFEAVVWRRVVNPPSYRDFLVDIVGAISAATSGLRAGTEEELERRLLTELKRSRCLVILDNFESVEPSVEMSDAMRREAEKYEAFIQLVGQADHQSTVVLAASEQPRSVAVLEGARRSVRSLELTGLDASSVRRLFGTIGRFRADATDWKQLTVDFAGNPLVLETVAHEVLAVFGGVVREYLSSEFAVPSSLVSRLSRTIDAMGKDERLLVYWVALNREPLSLAALARDMAHSTSSTALVEVLLRTRRKIRIEQDGELFFLLPAMLKAVTDRLVQDLVRDLLNGTSDTIDDIAVLKVSSKDYLRDAQREAIAVRVLNGMSNKLGSSRSVSRHLRAILQGSVTSSEHRGGYLVGNCLNLLALSEGELSDIDISGTLVREAYLRGIPVRDVNFSGCEFAGVAFDEAIGGLVSAAYRPDGGQFITGDMNGAVQIWNAASGEKTKALQLHDGWVRSVAYSQDGRFIATAGEDSRVQLWDLEHDESVYVGRTAGGRALAVALTSDPTRMAFGGDESFVSVLSLGTGARPLRLPGHAGRVWALAFSSCGSLLAVGTGSGAIGVWSLTGPEPHSAWWHGLGRIRCLDFSPDDRRLAVGTEEGAVFMLDLNNPDVAKEFGSHSAAVRSIEFSRDGAHLATGDRDGTIAIWNWLQGQKVKVFSRGGDCIRAVALHPNDTSLLAVTDEGFCIWDWSSARATMSITRALNSVWTIAACGGSSLLFAGYEDGAIIKWDLTNEAYFARTRLHSSRVRSLAFSAQNGVLASGGSDRRVYVGRSDLARTTFRRLATEIPWIRAIAISPNGATLVCGGGSGNVSLWDCRTLELLSTIEIGDDVVESIRFSWDGQSVIVATNSGRVQRIVLRTGEANLLGDFRDTGARAVVQVDTDGLAIGTSTGLVALCSLSTGAVTRLWEAHTSGVNALETFSGTSFASASNDGTVKLWDTIQNSDSGRPLAEFAPGSVPTAIAAVGTLGRLAIGCVDGRIVAWDPISGSCDSEVAPRPVYAGSTVAGVTGITEDQKRSLRLLGAVG